MTDSTVREPLNFESAFVLRDRLTEIYNDGGLGKVKEYISEEFTAGRTIEIGGKTDYIFDVQLRQLNDGKPGEVIVDFQHNPTVENSTLLLIANLINVEPGLQFLIRKRR